LIRLESTLLKLYQEGIVYTKTDTYVLITFNTIAKTLFFFKYIVSFSLTWLSVHYITKQIPKSYDFIFHDFVSENQY